ncbi:hypothetical protein BN889_04693 [Pseudomonas aeruginosa PA38182]|nr:hypothetical protein BN889_04693 [Pseudomonas aeruginosa PA38182]
MPRGEGGVARPRVVLAVLEVLGAGVGVAGRETPVGRQVAGAFQLEALAAHLAAADVERIVGRPRMVRVFLRIVLQVDAERRQRQVQAAVGQFALDPGFVGLAFHRAQRLAVPGLAIRLRLVDLGVADIPRPVPGEVPDQPAVGRELATGLEAGGRGVLVPPAFAAADHQGQRLGELDPAQGIEAFLGGGGGARRSVLADLRARHAVRVPAVDIDRGVRQVEEACGVLAGLALGVGDPTEQFVGQAEQSHRPIEVGVEAALDALELVGGAHQLATVAGLRVDGAEGAGVTQARIGFLVFGADLAFPAAAQLLFEGAEGAVGVPLEAVPVDIEVGVAGQSEIGPILGHRYPGHVGDRVDVLVLRTDGEQGVGAQVELGHPVEQAGTWSATS